MSIEQHQDWRVVKSFVQTAGLYLSLVLFIVSVVGLSVLIITTCTQSQALRAVRYVVRTKNPSPETTIGIIYVIRVVFLSRSKVPTSLGFVDSIPTIVGFTLWVIMLLLVLPLQTSWRSWIMGWPFQDSGAFGLVYRIWAAAIIMSIAAPSGGPVWPHRRK